MKVKLILPCLALIEHVFCSGLFLSLRNPSSYSTGLSKRFKTGEYSDVHVHVHDHPNLPLFD